MIVGQQSLPTRYGKPTGAHSSVAVIVPRGLTWVCHRGDGMPRGRPTQ
jgi:hypothetical protein